MRGHIESIKKELQDDLSRAAMEYLETAMDLSMKGRAIKFTGDYRAQPVVGNFAIAIELMLKAFIFSKNPALVFNLPLELRVAFISPESVGDDFNWRPFDVPLKSFEYKSMEMEELISTFYVLRPDLKQELQPFFKLFSQCRNVSIHASLPSFQKYEVERTAYLSLRLFKEISSTKTFGFRRHGVSKKVDAVLVSLDAERANEVKKKIEQAKRATKSLEQGKVFASVQGWWAYVTKCPVCGSDGVLSGDTDIDYGYSEEDVSLNFLADSFECEECKLILSDIKEMELAGMSTLYDRNEDIEEWLKEHRDHDLY
jgi:hypothetical protein